MTNPLLPGTALVTGASSGIGAVYAEKLAQRGHDLILVARNADRLGVLATRLAAETGRTVDILAADLVDEAGIAAVEARLHADASITLLVNNAGLLSNGPMAAAETGALTDMLMVNVVALTRLSAAAAKAFAARKTGGIVNLSSAMAFLDTPNTAAYGATKAFVLNLTISLDLELRPQGVQVQAVLPGYTRTPMIAEGAHLPADIVMETEDLVETGLRGFEAGELVTIPALDSPEIYENWLQARRDLLPFLSLAKSSSRYAA